jgi:hypothetical protein
VSHASAALTPKSRLRVAQLVVDHDDHGAPGEQGHEPAGDQGGQETPVERGISTRPCCSSLTHAEAG